jgi:hypothetical protein
MRKKSIIYPELNKMLLIELEDISNYSSLFANKDEYRSKYNLCCAIVNRLSLAVDYINSNLVYPLKENELILFMVYSCMIIDGVKTLYSSVFRKKLHSKEKKFFLQSQKQTLFFLPKGAIIDDDMFFEYLRSIMFAHPFETSRKYKEVYGVQISQYILSGYGYNKVTYSEYKDPIAVKIYTTNKTEIGHDAVLEFSFRELINYLISRYNKIEVIINWFMEEKARNYNAN